MLPVVLSWLGALSVQRKGYFFSNWLKETSAGQGRPCPERALVSVLTYVGHSPAATCPLPLVSPGEHSGWPGLHVAPRGDAATTSSHSSTPANYGFCALQSSASPHVTSPAEMIGHKQESSAAGWPPASASEWKEQIFARPATLCVAGVGQLLGNGCGPSGHNQGPRKKLKTPPQKALVVAL